MKLLKIGRDPGCDIVLRSSNASALHAEITLLNNGDILLEDKHSRNGTYIMNRPIKPGVQVSVKRGDAIRFADVELLWSQVPMPEDLSGYKAVYGIGTSMRNDIQLSGNTVSRYHATLKIDRKGKAYLQDHSKNGTTVNGQPLGHGQTRMVKRGDAVVCGGVPIGIDQFLPSNPWPAVLRIAACLIGVLVCGYAAYILWPRLYPPKTDTAMENASACVYGGYYFTATLKDNPFKGKGLLPDEWTFGRSARDGKLVCLDTKEYCHDGKACYADIIPFEYTGTAFFISEHGELGTNRHIAVPWASNSERIRQYSNEIKNYVSYAVKNSAEFASWLTSSSQLEEEAQAMRSIVSNIEIDGKHVYLGIGLTGSKVDNVNDLQSAQVIAESGDADKDVALIRLKSRKTPDYIIKMGAIYDIEHARVDEMSLKISERFTIVGYPMGEIVTSQSFDGKELHPTTHQTSLSKMADDNKIQIQAVGIGGQSGSPVCDSKHRLVGVLCSGFTGTEVTYCCNIKHLVELYNKHKVRE